MCGFKFLFNRMRCDDMCRSLTHVVHSNLEKVQQIRSYISRRIVNRPIEDLANDTADDHSNWPRKIFSGIQPTGALHLGNYLGAVRKWTQLQQANEDVTYCIVDMHSITIPQDPAIMRENIFKIAATIMACGINPSKSTLFVQSSVKEHSELCWILGTLCTMARLGHLPQYKDKTRQIKDIPLGLFVYPILQAADIMLYKATHVPVGEDQIQHIQLTQHLAKIFNSRFGDAFPICHAMVQDKEISRIRSLRDPLKKMSKSDPNPKGAIYLTDEPDVVTEKIKKAVTDFCSDVSYDPDSRPGVSNLIAIHSHLSGQPIEDIIIEARTLDTGKYKMRVAEAINEHLKPIREKTQSILANRNELANILETGAEKARNIAFDTVEEVKNRMGLGAPYLPLYVDMHKSHHGGIENEQKQTYIQSSGTFGSTTHNQMHNQTTTVKQPKPILEAKLASLDVSRKMCAVRKPMVPQQRMRVEKDRSQFKAQPSGKPFNIIGDITKELLQKGLLNKSDARMGSEYSSKMVMHDLPKIRRVARCVEVKPPPTIIPPVVSPQSSNYEMTNVSQTSRGCENFLSSPTQQESNELSVPLEQSPSSFSAPSSSPTPSSPDSSSSQAQLQTQSPSQSSSVPIPTTTTTSSLSVSKTTLPAAWPGANTKNSNGEKSTHNTTLVSTTTTTTTPPTTKNKRNFATSTTQNSCEKDRSTPPTLNLCRKDTRNPKQFFNKSSIGKILLCGVIAILAGFSGIYYFWYNVFEAYFNSKKRTAD